MTFFPLRDYQVSVDEAVANFVKYRDGHGYVTSPGGSGKSVMIARAAERCIELGHRTIILARNEKLLTQNRAKLSDPSLAGIYCAGLGERDSSRPITIASIQSIAVADVGKFDVALVDECDEINPDGTGQYWQFFNACGNPRIVGFTATPYRLSSGPIQWGEEIINIPIAPLIQRGFLIAPQNKITCTPDLSGIAVNLGEYVQARLDEVYTDPDLLYNSLEKIIQYSQDRQSVLIFTQSLRHSDMLAHAMEANGLSATTVSGDTDKTDLDFILNDFSERRFKFLINCQLLTVGVDLPCVDMIVLLRATKSKRLFEQMAYRGTRPYEGKQNFLLIDMGNNLMEHGALGSPFRGKSAGRETSQPQGKICPECESYAPLGSMECPDCAFQFPEQEDRKVSHAANMDTTSSATYTGDICTYEVRGMKYGKHVSRSSGNESLRVDYYCEYGKYGSISEWLPAKSSSEWARNKAWQFFKDRGVTLERPIESYEWSDLLWEASRLKQPVTITVDHKEKFPRVISYGWNTPALPAPEVDLDDEIVF